MSYIFLCNTGSDSLSKVNTDTLKVDELFLSNGDSPFGPHGLSEYNGNILITNNYNNSISIVNTKKFKEENNLYIGAHPNDITVISDFAYVTCGESNSLIVYDLINERIEFEIPTGRFPHDITSYKEKELVFASNMGENTISVVEINTNKEMFKIEVENTPLKIKISKNKRYLYVCMSYLGYDHNGYIGFISLDTLKLIKKIEVAFSPVDLYEEDDYLYVSNLCSGTISVINLKLMKEEKKIEIKGMPRGIVKVKDSLFVGDYLNGILNVIDLKEQKIRVITVGKEPNAMTLVK